MTSLVRFKQQVVPVDCGDGEVVQVELLSHGDLVFHGWDREADLAAVELGFDVDDLPCLALERDWYASFEQVRRTDLRIPPRLKLERNRVVTALGKKAWRAVSATTYDQPAMHGLSITSRNYRVPDHRVHLFGLHPTGEEAVVGKQSTVWAVQKDGGDRKRLRFVNLLLESPIQSYMKVLDYIYDGVVLDDKGRKILVASAKYFDKNHLYAVVGRQANARGRRGRAAGRVTSELALLRRHGPWGSWRVENWLS